MSGDDPPNRPVDDDTSEEKVIDRYQHEVKRNNGASSSGVHSGSSSPGELGRGRRRRQQKRDSHQPSPSPSPSPEPSSLEPMSQDDYAHSESSGHVSDTPPRMQNYSNEKGVYTTDDDEEHYKSFYSNPVDGALSNMNFSHKNRIIFPEYGGDIVEDNGNDHSLNDDDSKMTNGNVSMAPVIHANNNTWEENWLFQKKKIKTSQSVPVPMLIPNSNTEYRVLIGDRDADDTTDLSDIGSDNEEASSDIKHVLINSKTIIGGKNPDIVLAMVDPEDSPNDVVKDDDADNEKLDLRIDSDVESDNVKRDDIDDNFTLVANAVEENNNILTPDRVRKISSNVTELLHNQGEPKQRDATQSTRYALKSFLKGLESDNEGDFGVIEHFYGRSSSIVEEDVFSDRNVTEATNLDVVDGKDELTENLQKESEYTETVTVPVQRHMDSLKRQHYVSPVIVNDDIIEEDSEPPPLPPTPAPKKIDSKINGEEEIIIQIAPINMSPKEFIFNSNDNQELYIEPISENKSIENYLQKENHMNNENDMNEGNYTNEKNHINEESYSDEKGDINEENQSNEDEKIVASIAEREHKKWLNAVPMANNPYSPEAIQSRLNKPKQSSLFDYVTSTPKKDEKLTMQSVLSDSGTDYKRYGRDYYINDAKKSAGTRKKNKDVKYDSCPDEVAQKNDGLSPVLRATTDTSAPLKNNALNNSRPNSIESKQVKYETYSATPVVIDDDIDHQFEEIYKKAVKYDDDDNYTIYALPVDLNDKNTEKFLQMTNGVILQDSLDQSDSISSVDDAPRIYNVGTGTIVQNAKSMLYKNVDGSLNYADANPSANELPETIKEELVDLPSVKAIAKKFFAENRSNPITEKPKRRISKELLENEIVNKTMTNSHVKQPLHMHSITARSISKEFRDELKLSMPKVAKMHSGGTKTFSNDNNTMKDIDSPNQTVEHIPEAGSLKNKLAFFENISRQP